jgi:DNA-binding winged helix-turn-helix (wHTH) protein
MTISDTVVRHVGSVGHSSPPVELLHWPADADRREELRRAGRPRLLLLGADELPPGQADLEDWIRLPADEHDLSERLQGLAQRASTHREVLPGDVTVDEDGLVRWGDSWVALPPLESAIMARLVSTPGRLVARDELIHLVWGDQPPRSHSLDSRIFTLRSRLQPLGLAVHTIRGRGFLLTTISSKTTT